MVELFLIATIATDKHTFNVAEIVTPKKRSKVWMCLHPKLSKRQCDSKFLEVLTLFY